MANGSSDNTKYWKNQFSKNVQLGKFIFSPLDVLNLPAKWLILLVNSIAKESKNMGAKILNKDIFLEDLV